MSQVPDTRAEIRVKPRIATSIIVTYSSKNGIDNQIHASFEKRSLHCCCLALQCCHRDKMKRWTSALCSPHQCHSGRSSMRLRAQGWSAGFAIAGLTLLQMPLRLYLCKSCHGGVSWAHDHALRGLAYTTDQTMAARVYGQASEMHPPPPPHQHHTQTHAHTRAGALGRARTCT